MKKTTYCLITLLIGLFIFVFLYAMSQNREEEHLTIGVMLPHPIRCAEPITEIDFSMPNDASIAARIFSGLDIELTDSVDSPVLLIDSIYTKYVHTAVDDNILKIDVRLTDTSKKLNNVKSVTIIYPSQNFHPSSIKLIMPKWPLSRITSTHGILVITGLDVNNLQLYQNDILKMTDCHIDSAFFKLGGYARTRFKDCEINFMSLEMDDSFIKIDCCDSTSVIHKLDFKPVKNIKTDIYLNTANIDTLLWNRNDSAQITLRTKHPITIVK